MSTSSDDLATGPGLIEALHRDSVVCVATKSKGEKSYLVQRQMRLGRRHASSSSGSTEAQCIFDLYHSYMRSPIEHSQGLPVNAITIPLCSTTGFTVDDAYLNDNGVPFLIVDFVCTNEQVVRIIPMPPPDLYPNAPSRRESLLESTDLLPRFFVDADGTVGVPVDGPFDGIDPNRIFSSTQRTSLKILFHWPNIPWDKKSSTGQIQYRTTTGATGANGETSGGITISMRRAALLIAGAVANFMRRAEESLQGQTDTAYPPWRIGTQPGQIRTSDVILMGALFVSPGAAMPILRLRDGFTILWGDEI
ncbi:hypothetical protein K488DRAFT_83732 [Vararia minispora EC-137]|uniref:Uncharacterized protein n=1 Tax=Vararia minispora EC-137 TaxID=1314806 RepID=A0ACB8QTA6_9AGAM|nr:hypothetical protein K488DRAFT_83732 [Vararia minispora EC-137]